jgi:hypothetical protein
VSQTADGNDTGDLRRAVLLALHLRPFQTSAELAVASGEDTAQVESELESLARSGDVEGEGRRLLRFRLTAGGESAAAGVVAAERAALADRIATVYPDFSRLNGELKALLYRWQRRPLGSGESPNDHTDAAYDAKILAVLGALERRAAPLLGELAALRRRYACYRDRLARAAKRAGAGEIDCVAGVDADSFHSVWWQLHADLLAVGGIARRASDA